MTVCLDPASVYLASAPGGVADLPAVVFVQAASQPVDVSSCSYALVSGANAATLQQLSVPYDPVVGAAFWAFAVSFTVAVWFFAKNAGMVVSAVRRFL